MRLKIHFKHIGPQEWELGPKDHVDIRDGLLHVFTERCHGPEATFGTSLITNIELNEPEPEPERCTCDQHHEEDACPYSSEINGTTEMCQCCPVCRHECAMSI